MAKLIYAVTALALAALVSGFFVDSSNAPLLASIGLSALVMLLILVGWSRRIRKDPDIFEDVDESSVELAEIDEHDEDDEDDEDAFKREPVKVGAAEVTTVFDDDDAERTVVKAPKSAPRTATRTAAKGTGAKGTGAKGMRKKPPAKAKPAPGAKTVKPKAAAKRKPPAQATKGTAARAPARAGRVLVIPGRSRYHRPGCRFARGDQIREVSEATAQRRGYEPCNVCGS